MCNRLTAFLLLGVSLAGLGSTKPAKAGMTAIGCPDKALGTAVPEWHAAKESMMQLMATGQYEVRGVYRYRACSSDEFTVFVLQSITDRRSLYECTSDDTYRSVVGCFTINGVPLDDRPAVDAR